MKEEMYSCSVAVHVAISESSYFWDFKMGFCVLVWAFSFNQILNTELFCLSCVFIFFKIFFTISFFLNHMGDIEAGRMEDTHEDTIDCKAT